MQREPSNERKIAPRAIIFAARIFVLVKLPRQDQNISFITVEEVDGSKGSLSNLDPRKSLLGDSENSTTISRPLGSSRAASSITTLRPLVWTQSTRTTRAGSSWHFLGDGVDKVLGSALCEING